MKKIHSVTQFLRENFMQEQNSGGAFQIFQNIKKKILPPRFLEKISSPPPITPHIEMNIP